MHKYTKNFVDYIFQEHHEKLQVYLPGAKTKTSNYDKYHDVGYTTGNINYITVKALVRPIKEEELIIKTLGLVAFGAIKINIKDKDVNFFRLAKRITYNGLDYSVYNDAVGNKMQILPADFGYSIVTLFRKEI
jgi:hypothetical protein